VDVPVEVWNGDEVGVASGVAAPQAGTRPARRTSRIAALFIGRILAHKAMIGRKIRPWMLGWRQRAAISKVSGKVDRAVVVHPTGPVGESKPQTVHRVTGERFGS
jgi:hypothetical protein